MKQALLQNSKGLKIYRRDFLSACVEYADALHVRKLPEADSIGARILEDSGKLKDVRNQILPDAVLYWTRKARASLPLRRASLSPFHAGPKIFWKRCKNQIERKRPVGCMMAAFVKSSSGPSKKFLFGGNLR